MADANEQGMATADVGLEIAAAQPLPPVTVQSAASSVPPSFFFTAMGYPSLEKMTEPFTEVVPGSRTEAAQRALLAGCTRKLLHVVDEARKSAASPADITGHAKEDTKSDKGTVGTLAGGRLANGSLLAIGGLPLDAKASMAAGFTILTQGARTVQEFGSQMVSAYGNPIAELKTAPFFGDLGDYGLSRAVRGYVRLQLELVLLFSALFLLSLVHVVDNVQRNALRNDCRAQLSVSYDAVVYGAGANGSAVDWYVACGYAGAAVRDNITLIPDGWTQPLELLFFGPLMLGLGTCTEYAAGTRFTQPVPGLKSSTGGAIASVNNGSRFKPTSPLPHLLALCPSSPFTHLAPALP